MMAGSNVRAWLRIAALGLILVVCPRPLAAQPKEKAFILLGDMGNYLAYLYACAMAIHVQAKYVLFGYEVVLNFNATPADVDAALNDPNAKALWVNAHSTGVNQEGKYEEEIVMSDKREFAGRDYAGRKFSQFREVVLHCCGQDLLTWRLKFDTADANKRFHSWTTATNMPAISAWEATHLPPIASDPVTPGTQSVWPVDPRELPDMYEVLPGCLAPDWNGLQNPAWQMAPVLSQAFGDQKVNLYVAQPDGSQAFVAAFETQEGRMVNDGLTPWPQPDFDLRGSENGWKASFGDQAWFRQNWTSEFTLQVYDIPMPDDQVLIDGTAALLFGDGAVPEPAVLGLLSLGWLIGMRSRIGRARRL
jgi:hypothetical protein